jgi:O-succinylbenzoate synthase
MRIDAIEVFYVVLPLKEPFRWAYSDDPGIHSILVRMVSGEAEGWGETTPFYAPTYSPETATSAFFLISEIFAPILAGTFVVSADELLGRLHHARGNPMAKAGLESAWWMLKAVIEGQPLHRLIGGETRDVQAGADIGIQDDYESLLIRIQAAVDRGFQRVKLKVRPGWDLEMLHVVRSSYPSLTMHIDCNASYTLDDLSFFKDVDRLGLAMIEQPLFHSDLHDHAILQSQISTPICLDESVKSVRDFELAVCLGSCKMLNIKIGRVGGISVAVELHNRAREANIPCWVGGMLESGVGAGINIELATLPNFVYPGDLFESQRFYQQDLTDPEIKMNADTTFTPSCVPATQYIPDRERVDRCARKVALIRE